uniref:Uncharacterized protein n=1 Tax=Arundo donax TaxID=35708 RepID=A0A0A9T9L2_ARUDO
MHSEDGGQYYFPNMHILSTYNVHESSKVHCTIEIGDSYDSFVMHACVHYFMRFFSPFVSLLLFISTKLVPVHFLLTVMKQ